MRKINLFQQLTSQNFQRAKRIKTGVRIVSAIARKTKIINPVGLYIEASLCVTDAIYQYINLKENKQVTENLKIDIEKIKEQIKQYSKLISTQQVYLNKIELEHKSNMLIVEQKINFEEEKDAVNHLIFKETGTILKFVKDILEKEKQEMPDSKKISEIEKEFWKAISARNVALISLISENNIYEINF